MREAGDSFQVRLAATAAAYVRFATQDAALLELMFATKHSESAGVLEDASDRAFAVEWLVAEATALFLRGSRPDAALRSPEAAPKRRRPSADRSR